MIEHGDILEEIWGLEVRVIKENESEEALTFRQHQGIHTHTHIHTD